MNEAYKNPKFADNGKVEIRFSNRRELEKLISEPSEDESYINEPVDPVSRWDSYENFDTAPEDRLDPELEIFALEMNDTSRTQGPIDGNLYATVTKSQKPNKVITFVNGSINLTNGGALRRRSIDSEISFNTSTLPTSSEPPQTLAQPQLVHSENRNLIQDVKRYQPEYATAITNDNTPKAIKAPSTISVQAEVHHNGDVKSEIKEDKTIKTNGKPPMLINEKAQLDELLDDMMKEIEKFPDLPTTTSQTLKRAVNSETRMIVPKTETRIDQAKSVSKINHSPTMLEQPPSSSQRGEEPKLPLAESKAESRAVQEEFKAAAIVKREQQQEEQQQEEPVLIRPRSPHTTMTSHFGKIEPLPQRFLTKPLSRTWLEDEKTRPYHARPGSQPFSYGVTERSPALQRRRVHSESTAYVCESNPIETFQSQDEFDSDVFSNSPSEDMNHLSWLERQQRKLKNKTEGRDLKEKRIKEKRLIEELRGTVTKKHYNHEESSREASPSYSRPLHINTAIDSSTVTKPPLNTLSRPSSASPSYSTPTRVSQQLSKQYHTAQRSPASPPVFDTSIYKTSPRAMYQIQPKPTSQTDSSMPLASAKKGYEILKGKIDSLGVSSQQIVTDSKFYGSSSPYYQNNISASSDSLWPFDNSKDGLLIKHSSPYSSPIKVNYYI